MNPEDAEEYTEGLVQIVAGARRQMEEGARLGVPQALGLSPSEWVETRLGGSPGTGNPETREVVAELAPPSESDAAARNRRNPRSRRRSHGIRTSPASAGDDVSRRKTSRIKLRRPPRHWILIPFLGVLGMFAGMVWAVSTPPSYKSQSAAFVSMTALPADDPNHNDPFGSSQFALQRVQSYAQLATSPQVIQAAMNDLHRGDADSAAANIKVGSSGGVMLWVTVEDRDPQSAARVADAVLANLVSEVAKLEADGVQRSPVQIVPVQPAIVPDQPAGRGAFIKTMFGMLVGLALGGGVFHFIRRRLGGAVGDAEPAPGRQQAGADRDIGDVVVLRVGDGRDFSRKVGR